MESVPRISSNAAIAQELRDQADVLRQKITKTSIETGVAAGTGSLLGPLILSGWKITVACGVVGGIIGAGVNMVARSEVVNQLNVRANILDPPSLAD